jgi:hypothetical protein
MKYLTFLLLALFLISNLEAQQPPDGQEVDTLKTDVEKENKFKFFGLTQFNFNQAYFENWVSGGENSMTGLFSVDYNINYLGEKGWVWDNNLMLSIGTTYLSGNAFFRKADDRIEINSVLSKKVNTYWNYSAYFNFKTQMLPGYRYFKNDGEDQKEKISRILSPTIIQLGSGLVLQGRRSRMV